MSTIWVLAALLLSDAEIGLTQQRDDSDFAKTIETVRNCDLPKDLDVLRKIAEKVRPWPESLYGRSKVILEICARLNSAARPDENCRSFLQQLAVEAAAKEKAPATLRAGIATFIRLDHDYVENQFTGAEWETSRRKLCRTVLAAYTALGRKIDRGFDPEKAVPALNVVPPGGKYPAGVSPAAIEEPQIRKEYEAAIKANAEIAEKSYEQRGLAEAEAALLRSLEPNVVRAYSIAPINVDEAKADLEEYGVPAGIVGRVIKKLMKRKSALGTRTAPPKAQIIESEPPGTGPHHADPRLRKAVTFDLAAPNVEEVLEKLRTATGVQLTRAPEIQNKYWAIGSVSYVGVPAWQVMDNLAAFERVEGRWEVDGTGYRLVRNGNPVVIPEGMPTSHLWRNILIAAAAFFGLAIVGALVFMNRRVKSAREKE